MLHEVVDLDVPLSGHFVARDESARRQFVEQLVDVGLVVWKNLDLDAGRAIFEASFAVSQSPQTGEQQAS